MSVMSKMQVLETTPKEACPRVRFSSLLWVCQSLPAIHLKTYDHVGGAIGTGLFIGSGATLSAVGPAPLLMSYIVMSFVVYGVMNVLAEMTTYLPLEGLSVPYFVNRFVDPSLAFAMGMYFRLSLRGTCR
jgi:amino acid permease